MYPTTSLCIEFESPFYRELFTKATLYNSSPCRLRYIFGISLCQYKPLGVLWVPSSSTALTCRVTADDPPLAHGLVLPPSQSSLSSRSFASRAFARTSAIIARTMVFAATSGPLPKVTGRAEVFVFFPCKSPMKLGRLLVLYHHR